MVLSLAALLETSLPSPALIEIVVVAVVVPPATGRAGIFFGCVSTEDAVDLVVKLLLLLLLLLLLEVVLVVPSSMLSSVVVESCNV